MSTKEHIRRLKQDGWTVVEDVVPKSDLDAVRQEVEASTETHHSEMAMAKGIGHVGGFIAYNQALAPYLAEPRVLDPVKALLGPIVKISFTTATINLPGNPRGGWHADWPFNQNNAGHVKAPYPDTPMHVTTLWMLSAFSAENGGTLIVPGSHRESNNPTGGNGIDPEATHPEEMNASGSAGSVLVLDSRLWHSTAPNGTDEPRVSVVVRYAPWWLNTRVLWPDSLEQRYLVETTGKTENQQPPVPRDVFDGLPEDVKPLFSHWVGE